MAEPEAPDDPADLPSDRPPKPRRRPPPRRTPSKAGTPAALAAADAAAEVVHGAVEVGKEAVDVAKEVAEDALGALLEVLEGIGSTVRKTLAALLLLGVAGLALALFAVLLPQQFLQSFPYLFAAFTGATGALFLWLAWRLQGATSTLLAITRIAKRWRDRAAQR